MDTRSGALELSEGVATTGYEPLTPISIMVERTIAARPTSSFSVKAGDHFAVTMRGGEMTLSIRRDFAATHWKSLLVTDSPVPAVPPEYIEIKISQKTFVSLKVGDRVAVGITQQQTPFVAPGADTVYLSRVVGPAY